MEWQQFYNKNKKIIVLLCITSLILVITSILIRDYIKTKQNKTIKNPCIPFEGNLDSYIPSKGQNIFLEFCIKDKDSDIDNDLIKNISFRKSIFHVLDRKKIQQVLSQKYKQKIITPSIFCFNKDFYTDNKIYLPDKRFDSSLFSASHKKLYLDEDLTSYGFNLEKAKNLLKNAWNTLTPEQKTKKQHLKLNVDLEELFNEEEIQPIIVIICSQINNDLFMPFIQENNLQPDQLKILPNIPSEFNIRLTCLSPIDELNEEEYYHSILSSIYNKENGDIEFDFSCLKKYLDNQNIQDHEIYKSKQADSIAKLKPNYESQYPAVDKTTGVWKGSIDEFWDFYNNAFLKLVPREYHVDKYNLHSEELKSLYQKAYSEIYDKIISHIHKQKQIIPICCVESNEQ